MKNIGEMIGGAIVLGIIIALPVVLLLGIAEVSVWALDWIPDAIGWATAAGFLLILLAIVPAARGLAGSSFTFISLVYLVSMWLYAMAFTYLEWGLVGLVIGVMLFGIGVLFTGALAAIFAGAWTVLGNLAMLFVLFIVARMLGAWLLESADKRAVRKSLKDNPSQVTITQNSEEI